MRAALTLRQFEVLAAVKGGGSLSDVAKRLDVTRTGIYQVIQRLAASGHLKMGPVRELTPKGEKALAGAIESFRRSLAHAQDAA